MFCNQCGRPTEGDATLCPECAAAQTAAPAEPAQPRDLFAAYAAPAAEQPAEEAPVEEVSAQEPGFTVSTAEQQPPKKNSRKLIIAIAAVAAVLILAVALCWNSLSGLFRKTFSTPEEYFVYVHEQAADAAIADMTDAYGSYLELLNDPAAGTSSEMHILLSDELLSMLKSQSGLDMSWLKDILLTMDISVQDSLYGSKLGIGLGSKTALTLDMLMDMEKLNIYMTLPELAEGWMLISGEGPEGVGSSASSITAQMEQIRKLLPAKETFNTLLSRYTKLVLNNIHTVEKATEVVTVNGVSQELTVLKVKITEKEMVDIGIAILEQAKTDAELKQFLDQISAYQNELQVSSYTLDLHADMLESIEDALADAEEAKAEASENNYFLIDSYVTASNDLAGHTFAVYSDGQKENLDMRYITVRNGTNTAFEAQIMEYKISGTGTVADNATSGTYTVSDMLYEYFTVDLENMSETGGTVRFAPSAHMLSYIRDLNILELLTLTNPALQLSYTTTDAGADLRLELQLNGTMLVAVTCNSKLTEGGNLEIPANAVDVLDDEAIDQWASQVDAEAVFDKLIEAGVPEEFLMELLQLILLG